MGRKNFGPKSVICPEPVLIIAAYGEDGSVNAMNAAWGGIHDTNEIYMCLSCGHKTVMLVTWLSCTDHLADHTLIT